MLEIKNLKKQFGNILAVNNLTFTVNQGEVFGLLGPNGAGKTTTIRCILNIIKPDSGEILFKGETINEAFLNYVGYLPEERGLYTKSKVLDVISYFGQLKGMTSNDAKNEGLKLLKKLEISQYAERKINELSKGNQQKVQIITSLVHSPEILIVDEPFSGLDPVNQQLVKELFLEFISTGKSLILSTHQMEIAEKLCNKIILINKGEAVLSGRIAEIKKKFQKNSLFIKFDKKNIDFSKFPEIKSLDLYENSAELILNDNIDIRQFLKKIIDEVEINSFELKEPSLHSIFIDVVTSNKY